MADCEVCGGSGDYLIIDSFGKERYCIECPECFGTGEEDEDEDNDNDEVDAEGEPLPPASTASKIQSMDALKEWRKKEWGK